MENRQIECQEYSNNCENKKCFVMDRRKKTFGNEHNDYNGKEYLLIKPPQWPAEKHRDSQKQCRNQEKHFLSIKIKWP